MKNEVIEELKGIVEVMNLKVLNSRELKRKYLLEDAIETLKENEEGIAGMRLAIGDLRQERDNLQTVLEAWYAIFETNQLTHAQARLDQAEKEAKKYQDLLKRIDVEKIGKIMLDNFHETVHEKSQAIVDFLNGVHK